MVTGIIQIGDIPVKMACSADTPRRYRLEYGSDIFADMANLANAKQNNGCVEQMAYIMACQGNPDLNLSIGEWLDQFGPMDILQAADPIIKLWTDNMKTTSKPKKK